LTLIPRIPALNVDQLYAIITIFQSYQITKGIPID